MITTKEHQMITRDLNVEKPVIKMNNDLLMISRSHSIKLHDFGQICFYSSCRSPVASFNPLTFFDLYMNIS